jgi:hypothetical protein
VQGEASRLLPWKGRTIGHYRGLVTAYKTCGLHNKLVRELDAVVALIEREAGHQGIWPLPAADQDREVES